MYHIVLIFNMFNFFSADKEFQVAGSIADG